MAKLKLKKEKTLRKPSQAQKEIQIKLRINAKLAYLYYIRFFVLKVHLKKENKQSDDELPR